MFEAQLLKVAGSGTTEVWSPWFPRRGDNAICTVEVIAASGCALEVKLATKNTEDAGDGTVVSGSLSINAPGFDSSRWGPDLLLELVRYKFSVTHEGGWVLFRMLPPVWFDSATP